jgi:hypothetical protein
MSSPVLIEWHTVRVKHPGDYNRAYLNEQASALWQNFKDIDLKSDGDLVFRFHPPSIVTQEDVQIFLGGLILLSQTDDQIAQEAQATKINDAKQSLQVLGADGIRALTDPTAIAGVLAAFYDLLDLD